MLLRTARSHFDRGHGAQSVAIVCRFRTRLTVRGPNQAFPADCERPVELLDQSSRRIQNRFQRNGIPCLHALRVRISFRSHARHRTFRTTAETCTAIETAPNDIANRSTSLAGNLKQKPRRSLMTAAGLIFEDGPPAAIIRPQASSKGTGRSPTITWRPTTSGLAAGCWERPEWSCPSKSSRTSSHRDRGRRTSGHLERRRRLARRYPCRDKRGG